MASIDIATPVTDIADGVTADFDFPYGVDDAEDLRLLLIEEDGTRFSPQLGVDYTLEEITENGVTIRFAPDAVPAAGTLVARWRETPPVQTYSDRDNRQLPGRAIESALLTQARAIQDILASMRRAYLVPIEEFAEAGAPDLPALLERAGKFFAWDENGEPVAVDGLPPLVGLDEGEVAVARVKAIDVKGPFATLRDGGDGTAILEVGANIAGSVGVARNGEVVGQTGLIDFAGYGVEKVEKLEDGTVRVTIRREGLLSPAGLAVLYARISVWQADTKSIVVTNGANANLAQTVVTVNGLQLPNNGVAYTLEDIGSDLAIYVPSAQPGDEVEARVFVGGGDAGTSGAQVFYQETAPTPAQGLFVNDLWFNPSQNNHPYRWSGSAWVSLRDGTIVEVSGRVDALEGALADSNSRITAIEAEIVDANANLDTAAAAVVSLDTRVTAAEGAITAQAAEVTQLSSDITAGDQALGGRIDLQAEAISGLVTRVESVEGESAAQATQITALQVDLETERGRIDAANTAINAQAAVSSALDARVTQAEGAITANSSRMDTIEANLATVNLTATNNAIDALDARVTSTENVNVAQTAAITQLESDISTVDGKANANATAISNLSTRVTNEETKSTAQANALIALTAATGNNVANARLQFAAEATPAGATARFGLKVRAAAGDAFSQAAMYLDALAGGRSRVVFQADQFLVQDNGGLRTPFKIVNGVVVIDEARIKNLSPDNMSDWSLVQWGSWTRKASAQTTASVSAPLAVPVGPNGEKYMTLTTTKPGVAFFNIGISIGNLTSGKYTGGNLYRKLAGQSGYSSMGRAFLYRPNGDGTLAVGATMMTPINAGVNKFYLGIYTDAGGTAYWDNCHVNAVCFLANSAGGDAGGVSAAA